MKDRRNLLWTQILLFWTALGALFGALVTANQSELGERRYAYDGLAAGLGVFAGLCLLTAAVLEIAKRMPPPNA